MKYKVFWSNGNDTDSIYTDVADTARTIFNAMKAYGYPYVSLEEVKEITKPVDEYCNPDCEEDTGLQMYVEYRNGVATKYRYGEPWRAMQLYVDGGYDTPEEAIAAWERENEK